MACLHREDAKLKSVGDSSQIVCIICLVEYVTDKKKHVIERMEYGQLCLNILNQAVSTLSLMNKNIHIFLMAFETLWSRKIRFLLCSSRCLFDREECFCQYVNE